MKTKLLFFFEIILILIFILTPISIFVPQADGFLQTKGNGMYIGFRFVVFVTAYFLLCIFRGTGYVNHLFFFSIGCVVTFCITALFFLLKINTLIKNIIPGKNIWGFSFLILGIIFLGFYILRRWGDYEKANPIKLVH